MKVIGSVDAHEGFPIVIDQIKALSDIQGPPRPSRQAARFFSSMPGVNFPSCDV